MWNLFASAEIRKKRQAICNACEYITDKWLMIFDEKACSICKCSIPKKTKLKATSCPKKKW